MSDVRGYAEVVADLRDVVTQSTLHREAADLLTELAAALAERNARFLELQVSVLDSEGQWDRLTALLPDCPTCGGTGRYRYQDHGLWIEEPCPDCVHGKVSVAQLAATWQAVHHEPAYEVLQSHDPVSLLVDLRHAHEVRP